MALASASLVAPAPRRAEPHPHPGAYSLPVRLLQQATPPAGLRYALTSFWEERHSGRVQRTTLEKTLTLHYVPASAEAARLTYLTTAPILQKPDPSAFEKVLLLLASLYQHLELDIAPTGQVLALRNHAAILHTWEAVQQELVQRSGGEDEVTQILLASVSAQLQNPAGLLASLRYDYTLGLLLPDFYGQRFESGWRYAQPRSFPRFFANTDLWFSELLELKSPLAAGQTQLHLRGQLDPARTDLAAVAQQVAAELGAVSPPVGTIDPATLRGEYDALYQLDQATGWPLALDASVRCWSGDTYSKEYFLRLEQLPTL